MIQFILISLECFVIISFKFINQYDSPIRCNKWILLEVLFLSLNVDAHSSIKICITYTEEDCLSSFWGEGQHCLLLLSSISYAKNYFRFFTWILLYNRLMWITSKNSQEKLYQKFFIVLSTTTLPNLKTDDEANVTFRGYFEAKHENSLYLWLEMKRKSAPIPSTRIIERSSSAHSTSDTEKRFHSIEHKSTSNIPQILRHSPRYLRTIRLPLNSFILL